MFFRSRLFGLGWLLAAFLGASSALADAPPEIAPLNPAFVTYFGAQKQGVGLAGESSGSPQKTGVIPSPIDISHMTGKTPMDVRGAVASVVLPASFDLRSSGYVTSVKNQAACGDCWSFASMSSLESNMLAASAGSYDFSENHLNVRHGFDFTPCNGGNSWISTAYLARWGNQNGYAAGPVYESDDPYTSTAATSVPGLMPRFHDQEVLFLPNRASGTDNTNWKTALMQYGALYIDFWVDTGAQYSSNSAYWNNASSSYYFNGSSGTSPNHAVAIIGWDDNYPASNFSTMPPGNGAFILKNQWGTSWGSGGYFYLSYYDTVVQDATAFRPIGSTGNYARQYLYDPLGWTTSYGYGSVTGWGANIFTATGSESLSSVGFYTTDINTQYTVSVYTNVSAGAPTSGTPQPAATASGTFAYSGYHTVPLAALVPLTSGQSFSVVVRFVNSSYVYTIPLEYPMPGYSSAAQASVGQSFVSSNGSAWTDMTTQLANTNVSIHAYSVVAPAAPAIGTATPGNGQIAVSFTPGWDGGSAADSYLVNCGGITATGSASPITVTGLTNGVAYTCTVTAHNGVGWGAASAPSSPATPTAPAPLTRTYVSNNGNDANSAYSCDYAHPCRTFAVALGQTVAGGEILAIDSSGYGRVTIDRSVSIIAAPGVYAGIGVGSAGNATGVQIATAGVNVVLRGLTINGMGGTYGVSMTNGSKLSVENCVIANFPSGSGVYVSAPAQVRVVNTLIRDNWRGLLLDGGAAAEIAGSRFLGNSSNGILVGASVPGTATSAAINDSVVTGTGSDWGISVQSVSAAATARAQVTRTSISNGSIGALASSTSGAVASLTIGRSRVTGNGTGLSQSGVGATLNTLGNNTVADNTANTAGAITSLSPH